MLPEVHPSVAEGCFAWRQRGGAALAWAFVSLLRALPALGGSRRLASVASASGRHFVSPSSPGCGLSLLVVGFPLPPLPPLLRPFPWLRVSRRPCLFFGRLGFRTDHLEPWAFLRTGSAVGVPPPIRLRPVGAAWVRSAAAVLGRATSAVACPSGATARLQKVTTPENGRGLALRTRPLPPFSVEGGCAFAALGLRPRRPLFLISFKLALWLGVLGCDTRPQPLRGSKKVWRKICVQGATPRGASAVRTLTAA